MQFIISAYLAYNLINTMGTKQERYVIRLRSAIARSADNADIKRHQIICEALYNLIKECPNGPNRPDSKEFTKVKREPNSGWSVVDVTDLLNPAKPVGHKAEALFNGIEPTSDEVAFVLKEMTELGVLTVKRDTEKTVYKLCTHFGTPVAWVKRYEKMTTYKFNKEFKNFRGSTATEANSPKRRRRNYE